MTRLILTLALALLSFAAGAQTLTPQQRTAVRAFACADVATARAYVTGGNTASLRPWLNAAGAFVVWRTNVSDRDILASDAFDWTRVDNLTNGKARIWDYLLRFGSIDVSKANVRAGIDAAWVGTAADLAVRASIYAVSKRNATRAEQALATGAGTTPSPGVMTFEGPLSDVDVARLVFADDGALLGC